MPQAVAERWPPVPPDPKDLDAIHEATTKSAEVASGLWLSYLFVLFYLLVAVAGVTHTDLLLENPVKLPFLSVDLPLTGFFKVGPLLFLIAHAYVLLHFVLLAERAQRFVDLDPKDAELQASRARLVWKLPANLFVQLLAGPAEVRHGFVGLLIWLVAWISLMLGPVALLLFFQLQFLPYHDEWITWWQRLTVVIDLGLLWMLWPKIFREEGNRMAKWTAIVRAPLVAGLGVLAIPMAFGVATFPGEALQERIPFFFFREALVAGQIDDQNSRLTSVWSNRLVLPGLDLVDHKTYDTAKKLDAAPVIQKLRGRHLEAAVLIDASLPRVDFTNAHLEGAAFNRAKLQGSWFDNATMIGAQLDNATLQGASLYQSKLQGASLDQADLQGAILAGALLGGTQLVGAQLQGVSLSGADLRGVSLSGADLRGADLSDALLQGASLHGARLDGASFLNASIWRTDFRAKQEDKVGMRGVGPSAASQVPPCMGAAKDVCASAMDIGSLHRVIDQFVAASAAKDAMLARLRPNLDPGRPIEDEDAVRDSSDFLRHSDAEPDVDQEELAKVWREIACAVDGAPFVLTRFIETRTEAKAMRFTAKGNQLPILAAFLNSDHCAGKTAMAELTGMELIELAESIAGVEPRELASRGPQ